MTSCAPGTEISSTGVAAMVKPAARQSSPISAPVSHAARKPGRRIGLEQPADRRGGRMGVPVRRPQAGDPAALLIDHDVGVGGQHLPQRGDQCGQLRRVLDVAGKQDDAGRRECPEQRGFLGQQDRAGDADDGGAWSAAPVIVPIWSFTAVIRRDLTREIALHCCRCGWPSRSEISNRAAAAFGADVVAEGSGLGDVGETRGPHPPERAAVPLDARVDRLPAVQQVRHALRQLLPLVARRLFGAKRRELHHRPGVADGAGMGFALRPAAAALAAGLAAAHSRQAAAGLATGGALRDGQRA